MEIIKKGEKMVMELKDIIERMTFLFKNTLSKEILQKMSEEYEKILSIIGEYFISDTCDYETMCTHLSLSYSIGPELSIEQRANFVIGSVFAMKEDTLIGWVEEEPCNEIKRRWNKFLEVNSDWPDERKTRDVFSGIMRYTYLAHSIQTYMEDKKGLQNV